MTMNSYKDISTTNRLIRRTQCAPLRIQIENELAEAYKVLTEIRCIIAYGTELSRLCLGLDTRGPTLSPTEADILRRRMFATGKTDSELHKACSISCTTLSSFRSGQGSLQRRCVKLLDAYLTQLGF